MGAMVAKTHANREGWASENMVRLGFEPYCPRIAVEVRTSTGIQLVAKPLFPTYVFVVSPHGRWRQLLSTWGVTSLIMRGGGPATVDDSVIKQMRSREDDAGLIILPERPELRKGDKIKVLGGPFVGCAGVYSGMSVGDRQKVLLNMLGGMTSVLIAPSMIEACAA